MWELGDTTLPSPQGFRRQQRLVHTSVQTLDGTTKRDSVTRKETYLLFFEKLTQSEIADILTEYQKNTAVAFSVTDGSLTISSKNVFITLSDRFYAMPGSEFRENLQITLTEV